MSQQTLSKTTQDVTVKHVTLSCQRSFDDVRAALEKIIPELTTQSARTQFDSGDVDGAIKRLQELPALVILNIRPRHIGPMLASLNSNSKVVQVSDYMFIMRSFTIKALAKYEIGNPILGVNVAKLKTGVGLYFPARVFLSEVNGTTTFEYDSIVSSLSRFEDEEVTRLAEGFEANLEKALNAAGGAE